MLPLVLPLFKDLHDSEGYSEDWDMFVMRGQPVLLEPIKQPRQVPL